MNNKIKHIELDKENAIDIIQFAASTEDGITLKYNVIMERKSPLIMLEEIEHILKTEQPMNAFEILPDHRRTKAFPIDALFDNEDGTCWHYVVAVFINKEGKNQKARILINLEDGEENNIAEIISTLSDAYLMDFGRFEEIYTYKKRSDILRVLTILP